MDGFETLDQFAKRMAVDHRTAGNWCRAGLVPGAIQTPGGHWRVPIGAGRPAFRNLHGRKQDGQRG